MELWPFATCYSAVLLFRLHGFTDGLTEQHGIGVGGGKMVTAAFSSEVSLCLQQLYRFGLSGSDRPDSDGRRYHLQTFVVWK